MYLVGLTSRLYPGDRGAGFVSLDPDGVVSLVQELTELNDSPVLEASFFPEE